MLSPACIINHREAFLDSSAPAKCQLHSASPTAGKAKPERSEPEKGPQKQKLRSETGSTLSLGAGVRLVLGKAAAFSIEVPPTGAADPCGLGDMVPVAEILMVVSSILEHADTASMHTKEQKMGVVHTSALYS